MGNRDKIIAILQQEGPLCDGRLTHKTHIKNHATVNQITRELANEGLLNRSQGFCSGDNKVKLINRLIDGSEVFHKRTDDDTGIDLIADTNIHDDVKQNWYWEGNIQNKIVNFLKTRGYKILQEANTALKAPGVDIIAISPDMKRLLVSVKGFPYENNKNKNTQARHWFAEAIFDLVLYRQDFPEVILAIGLPDGFATYQNLSPKVAWFKESLPFNYFWVTEDGNVREE